jgi:hypothetical protein
LCPVQLSLSHEGQIRHFGGIFFVNDFKNLTDAKTIFQIFNCKLTYNDYTHTNSNTNPIFNDYNLRSGKAFPKNGGVRKAN